MDSRQLRYFAAIYENGTLSRASEQLRVAISALSHHLGNLERDLGAPLFLRKARGLRPTAAGERLYEHARIILSAMEAAEADVRTGVQEVTGDVSVGMAFSAVKAIAVPLMQRVLKDYPKLGLSLSEGLSGSTLMHLMTSEVDLALVYNPSPDPRLQTQAVLDERMVCVGPRAIIGDTDASIGFEELLELPLILLRQGMSGRALLDNATLLKKLERRARFQVNSVNAISGALRAGLGCTIGTRLIMRDELETGALHARQIIEPELSRTLYLCELSDNPVTFAREKVRALLRELALEAVTAGRWDATASSLG